MSIFGNRPAILGNLMFNECNSLLQVCGTKGISSIPNNCFQVCSALNSFEGETITNIGANSFIRCKGLTDLSGFTSLTSIGSGSFSSCEGLNFDIIEFLKNSKVTSVGASAFLDATNLYGVWDGTLKNLLGANISIGASAFSNTNVTMGKILSFDDTDKIDDYKFAGATELKDTNGNTVTNIDIPENITQIGEAAFSGCTGIKSIKIDGALHSLGKNCFSGCSSLEQVTFNNESCDFTEIPDDCFKNCLKLKIFELPSSVKTIGNTAFHNTSISSIDLRNIEKLGSGSFDTCNKLTSIGELNENLSSIPYACFVRTGLTGTVTIPSSVTSVGNYSFNGCTKLKTLIVKGKFNRVPYSFCGGSTTLETVKFENSVTSLDPYAFDGCQSLVTLSITWDQLTSIGDFAFKNCIKLTSEIHLSQNCQYDYDKAFQNCGLILR